MEDEISENKVSKKIDDVTSADVVKEVTPKKPIRGFRLDPPLELPSIPLTGSKIKLQDHKRSSENPFPDSQQVKTSSSSLKRKHTDQLVNTEKLQKLTIQKPPENKILAGVRLAISGFIGKDRDTIKKLVTKMGGKIDFDVGVSTTHVVTAFDQTPKITKLKKIGKGFVIRMSWLDDCFSMGYRQNETEKSYKIWAPEISDEQFDDEIEQATKKLKLSIQKRAKMSLKDLKIDVDDGNNKENSEAIEISKIKPENTKKTEPIPISTDQATSLSKCAVIFSSIVQQQPYFPNLIRAIYCGGGLCLQDIRFFTTEQIFKNSEHFLYIGEERHLSKILKQIDFEPLSAIKSQIQFVQPDSIFKKVDRILTEN